MSTELDDLFAEASPEPGATPDAERLWTGGRRRRRFRQGGAVLGSLAAIAVVGVAATSLTGVATPTVDTAAAPETAPTEEAEVEAEAEAEEPTYELERGPNELAEVVVPDVRPAPRESAEEQQSEAQEAPEAQEEAPAAEEPAGPQPDAARVADPCAAHRGGEPRVFIDVVAPVQSQQVSGTVQLVGCASVFEGTVRYRLSGPGGVLADSHTMGGGGPEIGEFRETLSIGQGSHTLEVFWDDAKDGSEAGKSTITFEGR